LCVSPLAKGLFHKVIAHSGGRLDKRPELKQAASAGAELARAAGKTSVRQLRGMPALALQAAADSAGFHANDIVDGWVLPKQPWDIYAAAGQHPVPTLLGYNQDEGTTLKVEALVPPNEFIYRGNVRRLYDDHADDYLKVYPSTDMKQSCLDGFRDYWCGWPTIAWARMTHAAGQNSYVYRFAHKPPGKRRKELGAYHGGELAYVFDNVHLFGSKANVADYELAEIMSAFWASFATTGVPAVKRENTWPTFASGRQLYMLFEDGRAIVYADLFEDRRELWDDIMATLRSA